LPGYKPREKNVIQEILHDHFKSFEENYDAQYSEKYGKYRIIRIKEAVEKLGLLCEFEVLIQTH